MIIKINKNEYNIHFGLSFVREMDKLYEIQSNGVRLGLGVENAIIGITQLSPVKIFEIIKCATVGQQPKLKDADIDKFIEEHEDFEGLCDDFLELLKTASLTKGKTLKVLEENEKKS